MKELDVNADGQVDFSGRQASSILHTPAVSRDAPALPAEFLRIQDKFPMIFFPAFRIQDVLRRATLGTDRWLDLVGAFDREQRIRTNGRPVSYYDHICRLAKKVFEAKKAAKRAGRGPSAPGR